MPVKVNVPIRLRLSGRVDGQLDEIEDAVNAAVERALVRSRAAVIDARGGYVSVNVAPPRFTWRGDLSETPGSQRQEIEQRVSDAITRAARAAGLFDYLAMRLEAPEVAPPGPSEALDPERHDEALELYLVPSYGKKPGKKKKGVKVKGDKKGKKDDTPPEEQEATVIAWDRFASEVGDPEFARAVVRYMARQFGEGKAPPVVGVVYQLASDPRAFLGLLNVNQRNGEMSWRMRRFPIQRAALATGEENKPVVLDEWGSFTWTRVVDPAEALKRWRTSFQKRWAERLGNKKVVLAHEAEERAAELNKIAEEKVKEHTAGWEQEFTVFYEFHHPAGHVLFPIPAKNRDAMPPSGSVVVVPIARKETLWVTPSEDEEDGTGAGIKDAKDVGEGGGGGSAKLPGYGDGEEGGVAGGIGLVKALSYDARNKMLFPQLKSGKFEVTCEPWEDREPSVKNIPGAQGEPIWDLIQKIAAILGMEPCDYAAHFAMSAAKMIGARAAGVGQVVTADQEGFLEHLAVGEVDQEGRIVFTAAPSQAIQYLRALAPAMPLWDELVERIRETDFYKEWGINTRGYWLNPMNEAMELSSIWIFLYGCQISMLQVLSGSRRNIQARLTQIGPYSEMTRLFIQTLLTDQYELIKLREALKKWHDFGYYASGQYAGEEHKWAAMAVESELDVEAQRAGLSQRPEEAMERARKREVIHLSGGELYQQPDLLLKIVDQHNWVLEHAEAEGAKETGFIVKADDGTWVIRDSNGFLWSLAELNDAIAKRQQYLEAMDPILHHIHRFTNDIPRLGRDPSQIRPYLENLLNSMLRDNADVRGKVLNDAKYAFEYGAQIRIDSKRQSGSRYILSGVHRIANEQLEDAFNWHYHWAREAIINHRYAWLRMRDDFLFIGQILISVVCPPLGVITGIVEGIWRVHEAKKLEELYNAILDPQDIISRAEVEAQMFMAQLGLALSFIPVVGRGLKVGAGMIKQTVRQGIKKGAKQVLMGEIKALMREMSKDVVAKVTTGLIQELTTGVLMEKLLADLLGDVVEDVIRQVEPEIPVDVPDDGGDLIEDDEP